MVDVQIPSVSSSAGQVPVHDKMRRDQIGAELWLLKRCRADAAARFEEEEAKAKRGAEDAGQAANANRGGDYGCFRMCATTLSGNLRNLLVLTTIT